MSDNLKIFAASTVPEWVSDSFPTIRIVLLVLIVLLSIALVITVLFQSSNDGNNNINAVTGGSTDTFYGKHRSQSLESILKRITVILAIVIAVLAVLFFVTTCIYYGPETVA
jgi:preprotein translocase subunit SecG